MHATALRYRNLLLFCMLALSACGFHLRGLDSLPFKSLYLQNSGATTLAREVQLSLKSNGVTVLSSPEGAEGSLELMSENTEKRILSLSGNGRVREYLLVYSAVFRIRGAGEELWGEPQTVEQRRDYTFNDAQTLAKEAEEARLYKDMRNDVVREIMRRVSVLSKQRPVATETTPTQ